jgi:hypothetical protein
MDGWKKEQMDEFRNRHTVIDYIFKSVFIIWKHVEKYVLL